MRFEFKIDDRDVQLEVSADRRGYTVAWDDARVRPEVLHAGPSRLDFLLDGRRHRAWIAASGDERHVFLDGRTFTLRRPADEDDADAGADAAGPNVAAAMPGKVVKLLTAVGRRVAEGEGLVIMESMKMETEIAATVAGTVAAIHVEDGQTVAMGDPLLDIDPAGEGGD